jgi:adhesin transport system membrane fusion protein
MAKEDHLMGNSEDDKKTTDLDFMSDINAATRLQPSWQANILLYVICALFIFIIIWANIAKLEVITRGEGKVVPTSEIQLVQSLEGGILAELNINEGDKVTKGQILARIENVAFASEERGIEAQSLALKLKQARLNAEINENNFAIPDDLNNQNKALSDNELSLYQSRQNGLQKSLAVADEIVNKNEANLKEIDATIQRLRDSKNLLSQQLKITRNLVAKNAMPKLEALKQEREFSEISGNLNASIQRKKALEADLAAAKNSRGETKATFKSEALTELSTVETQLSGLKESLTAAGDRVDRTELRAPADGVVKTINQKTIGGIVDPSMKLIEIVPLDEDLKITAKILPADIAFLKIDQDVNVKITAYDSSKFGALRGKLKRISADTIEDKEGNIFFEIDVLTDKNYLGSQDAPLPIIPGMVAQAEIITGKRTVMYYLAKPFLRARDRAMTEQ